MIDKILKFLKIKFQSQLVLKDGTPLELAGDLETGVQVSVVTTDGTIALPDGEYQLEDMTIIMVKDGLIMDIIKPGEVEEPVEGLDPMGNDVGVDELAAETPEIATETEDLATQKGNPEVTGEEPVMEDAPITEELPEMEPEIEPEMPENGEKLAEMEAKIAAMETVLTDIMSKLNMISEKFSAAQPIVKKKEVNEAINPKLQSKVDLINKLKGGNKDFIN